MNSPHRLHQHHPIRSIQPHIGRRQVLLPKPCPRVLDPLAAVTRGEHHRSRLDQFISPPYCVAKHKDNTMTRDKTIHCRLTAEEHAAIKAKADAAGLSITQFVVRAALAQTQ